MKELFTVPLQRKRLFHGTSGAVARKALQVGLVPRGKGAGHWPENPSNPKCVYLTDTYAPYFAFSATDGGSEAAIVEVLNDAQLRDKLLPDEDFLEQVSREQKQSSKRLDRIGMNRRTKLFKTKMKELQDMWPHSMLGLGTVAHSGSILPASIVRVAFIDTTKLQWLMMYATDATITLANHKFCSWKYRNLTHWIFGEALTAKEFYGEQMFEVIKAQHPTEIANVEKLLANRDGITYPETNPTIAQFPAQS